MASCPNCGKEVPPQAVACPSCGHPLQQAQATSPTSRPTGPFSPRSLAFYSIICGIAAWLFAPLPLWIAAAVLGILAMERGEVRLGAVGLILGLIGISLVILALLDI